MSKIHSLLTYVVPLLGVVGILQIFLIAFSRQRRKAINFSILTVLGISSIRPNILGETFGLIGPLYFFMAWRLSKTMPEQEIPIERQVKRARNGLAVLWIITFSYWISIGLTSSFRTYGFGAWPPIANLGTVGIDGFLLLQIFKTGYFVRLVRTFVGTIIFEASSGLISKYLFHYHLCAHVSAGRGWHYSVCIPGAVFSSDSRLTGIGGEPAIFSTYLSLMIIMVWWPQLRYRNLFAFASSAICLWAALVSGSTTGATEVFFAVALSPFQRFSFKKAPIYLTAYGVGIFYVLNSRIVQKATSSIMTKKLKTNKGSITDRNLNFGLHDYLSAWGKFPFGSEWSSGASSTSFHINLLADSLAYGPYVIFLFFLLIISASLFSPRRIHSFSAGAIIFTTCLFIEPAWLNAIWLVLLYMILLASLIEDSPQSDQSSPVKPSLA